MTLPMMTSFTASLGMVARRVASATTRAPSLVAEILLNAPLSEPMGVRTALTMTTSRTMALLLVMIHATTGFSPLEHAWDYLISYHPLRQRAMGERPARARKARFVVTMTKQAFGQELCGDRQC